jgi:serine/threonine protein kinase
LSGSSHHAAQHAAAPANGRRLSPPATRNRRGDQLDHYRIEGVVARSGMASIFRATDMRNGRQVAIKIPHPGDGGDPVLFDRFQREQEIGRNWIIPGVMKVLDAATAAASTW